MMYDVCMYDVQYDVHIQIHNNVACTFFFVNLEDISPTSFIFKIPFLFPACNFPHLTNWHILMFWGADLLVTHIWLQSASE